ncbi:MAG: hypothetical protein OSA40_07545 [Phycisphaerales bacterium]|nr:hypothetical protein [Phycisphaerales bacterium]
MIVLLVMLEAGGHPTAQMNSATGPGRDWWLLWFDFWPLAMVFLLGAIVGTFVLLVVTGVVVIRTKPRRHVTIRILHATLSVAQPVLMLFFIGQYFPDA